MLSNCELSGVRHQVCGMCHRLKDVLEVEPYNGNATLNLAVIYMDLQRNFELKTA